MSLKLMDGFEFAPTMRNAASGGGTVTAQTGRDGIGKAVSFTAALTVPFPTALAAATIVGVGVWAPSSVFGLTTASLSLLGDGGGTTHLSLTFDATGHVQLRRGTGSGTVIATGTTALTASTWHYFEVKATIDDTTGTCIVKVDGTTEVSFTGDTRNAGTLLSLSAVLLGGTAARFDDLVVCDTTGSAPFNDFFGEKVIRLKGPNGNGATSQWAGSDGNSTDNYQLVDELPVSSTDYTGSAVAGERDLYALSTASLATVDAIQDCAYVVKTDAGARSFKTVTRDSGGTVTTSTAVALSTTYGLLQGGIEQTTPTGGAWSYATVNAIQAGVETV